MVGVPVTFLFVSFLQESLLADSNTPRINFQWIKLDSPSFRSATTLPSGVAAKSSHSTQMSPTYVFHTHDITVSATQHHTTVLVSIPLTPFTVNTDISSSYAIPQSSFAYVSLLTEVKKSSITRTEVANSSVISRTKAANSSVIARTKVVNSSVIVRTKVANSSVIAGTTVANSSVIARTKVSSMFTVHTKVASSIVVRTMASTPYVTFTTSCFVTPSSSVIHHSNTTNTTVSPTKDRRKKNLVILYATIFSVVGFVLVVIVCVVVSGCRRTGLNTSFKFSQQLDHELGTFEDIPRAKLRNTQGHSGNNLAQNSGDMSIQNGTHSVSGTTKEANLRQESPVNELSSSSVPEESNKSIENKAYINTAIDLDDDDDSS